MAIRRGQKSVFTPLEIIYHKSCTRKLIVLIKKSKLLEYVKCKTRMFFSLSGPLFPELYYVPRIRQLERAEKKGWVNYSVETRGGGRNY